jgi:hypothetical protein
MYIDYKVTTPRSQLWKFIVANLNWAFPASLCLAVMFVLPGCAAATEPGSTVAARLAVVARYTLPGTSEPTGVATGVNSLWVIVPSTGGPPTENATVYGRLERISETTGRIVETSAVGGYPQSLAIAGSSVWVANAADDPSLHYADENTLLELSPPDYRVTQDFGQQNIVGLDANVSADASGVWDIDAVGTTTSLVTFGSGTQKVLGSLAGYPVAIEACSSRLYVATTNDEGSTDIDLVSAESGLLERTWTLQLSAQVSLRCLSGGVLAGLDTPDGGGLFDFRDGSKHVPSPFGARTQFGVALSQGDVWVLTSHQSDPSAGTGWTTGLSRYSLRTHRQLGVPLLLGASYHGTPIAPAGLEAEGKSLWAIVGMHLLKIAIGT